MANKDAPLNPTETKARDLMKEAFGSAATIRKLKQQEGAVIKVEIYSSTDFPKVAERLPVVASEVASVTECEIEVSLTSRWK